MKSNSKSAAPHFTSSQHHITLMSRPLEGWVTPALQVFRHQGKLGKWGPNSLNHVQRHTKYNLGKLEASASIFLKLSNFIILTYGNLNFLSRMGSINSFAQTFQEILLNNYLAINSFENSEIRNFVPNWTRTHNHLVHKRTLNHFAKLAR